jgi:DNA-binding NarL/FixJ family response regulator
MPLRVLLADDHDIVRQGLRALLEREGLEVVGEAADGREAVGLAQNLCPEVAVLDLAMPLMNGLDAAREILESSPRIGLILLTMQIEDHLIVAALRSGIRGYVQKTQAAEELYRAIGEVARGGVYLSSAVSRAVAASYLCQAALPPEALTPQERRGVS